MIKIKQYTSNYARSLIEASLDPLITISSAGEITDTNEAMSTITGVSKKELIGTHFYDYFTEPERAREVYQKIFLKGFVKNYPLTIRDGKLTDVLFNGSLYKDEEGNALGAVVVARDVTEQKRIERELMNANIKAEEAKTMAEKAREKAEKSMKIAEEALKSKQQFLSNMSHEIRTPMNAIIGFTKVILKTEISAKQKEYLNAIKTSGDSMVVLINDILDLAKVDSGNMVFEEKPFRLVQGIKMNLQLFENKIQEKNLVLHEKYDSYIPEIVLGDAMRLNQIMLNLLSNAIKFTQEGSITVKLKLVEETNETITVLFSVSDTGIGIPEDKKLKIFENFQQATNGTSRIYGGTGLGLAIVKQLIESQKGTIHLTSKLKHGSTFSFKLNFKKTIELPELEVEGPEYNSEIKNIRILVVEDIKLNQLLMKTLLDDFGFDYDIAENGKVAIEMLKNKNNYDIILMDLQMPEMNGFEATNVIRKKLKLKTPIIALTADVTTVDIQKCKAAGMNDYIAKPVDERILYSKMIGLVHPKSQINKNIFELDKVILKPLKLINLEFLHQRTKSDPILMKEIISLYLEQTPVLINAMKKSLKEEDWKSLQMAVHKMIPSFSIMGINKEIENVARQIQEFARSRQQDDGIHDLIELIEKTCEQSCIELQEEIKQLKFKNEYGEKGINIPS